MNIDEIARKYRTVALEGCGGVGKSEIARYFGEQHGFTVVHPARTPDHLDLAGRFREILAGPGRILFDRCFISELVYGPLDQGRSRLTWSQAIDLAESVQSRSGVLVHLTAPPALICRRLLARDGVPRQLDEVSALVTQYERTFATLAQYTHVLTFDTAVIEAPRHAS